METKHLTRMEIKRKIETKEIHISHGNIQITESSIHEAMKQVVRDQLNFEEIYKTIEKECIKVFIDELRKGVSEKADDLICQAALNVVENHAIRLDLANRMNVALDYAKLYNETPK